MGRLANRASLVFVASATLIGRSRISEGKVVWGQAAGSKSDDTLKVDCKKHCERFADKAMSGEGVKASSRISKRSPSE
jgi:hypothetical protein